MIYFAQNCQTRRKDPLQFPFYFGQKAKCADLNKNIRDKKYQTDNESAYKYRSFCTCASVTNKFSYLLFLPTIAPRLAGGDNLIQAAFFEPPQYNSLVQVQCDLLWATFT